MNIEIKHLWLHKCPKKWNQYTLIALVITIIVLLILAGISISMLAGDNSILQKATDAKQNSERAEAKEQARIDIMAWITDKTANHEDASLDDNKVKEILSDNKSYVKEAKTSSFITSKGEYEIPYSELYTKATPTGPKAGESGYAGGSYNDPYIPVGFTHTGSETWNQGYTITGNDGSTNSGDQFVWVPCSTAETLPEGVVRFQKTLPTTTSNTDPNYKYNEDNIELHPSGGTNANVDAEDSSVAAIRTSVGTYGGFYIAKYEAGCPLDEDNNEIVPADESTITDFTKRARSVSGANPWNCISKTNAITASSNMVTGSNVTSALISGECWDTALAWITLTADSSYAINSEGKGWYSDVSSSAKHTTGYYGTNTNNIFDLGGNMFEWTTEKSKQYGAQVFVERGGNCGYTGSNKPAASRGSDYSTGSGTRDGFRVVLYK